MADTEKKKHRLTPLKKNEVFDYANRNSLVRNGFHITYNHSIILCEKGVEYNRKTEGEVEKLLLRLQ